MRIVPFQPSLGFVSVTPLALCYGPVWGRRNTRHCTRIVIASR